VQNRTQALQSAKGHCNTFDLNRKWAKTLALGLLQEIFIGHTPNIQVEI
jgi:hypothetical protein